MKWPWQARRLPAFPKRGGPGRLHVGVSRFSTAASIHFGHDGYACPGSQGEGMAVGTASGEATFFQAIAFLTQRPKELSFDITVREHEPPACSHLQLAG